MSSVPALPRKKQSGLVSNSFFPSSTESARFEQMNGGSIVRLDERVNPAHSARANQRARGKRDQFPAPAFAARLLRHVHRKHSTVVFDLKSHHTNRFLRCVLTNVD